MMNSEWMSVIDQDIIDVFRRAVEIGKWPDGRELSKEQRETCMQAIIVYEHQHLSPEQRTGYVPPKESACAHEAEEQAIKWESERS